MSNKLLHFEKREREERIVRICATNLVSDLHVDSALAPADTDDNMNAFTFVDNWCLFNICGKLHFVLVEHACDNAVSSVA